MPNPFHDPRMAPIVRAVASQRAQVRPALISAADLQLIREFYAWHLELFESEQLRQVNLGQAITNCRSALSYIDALDPTTIDKGIVTALLGWHRYSRDIAETNGLDSASSCYVLTEKVQETLLALQTRVSAECERP